MRGEWAWAALAVATALLGLLAVAEPTGAASSNLQSRLEQYVDSRPGNYGVAIRNLASGETVLINADQPMLAASTYKLLVMYRVYQQVEAGKLSMDEDVTIIDRDTGGDDGSSGFAPGQTTTVGDLLEAMITISDNVAAWALARRVGGWSVVESAATELGMGRTYLQGSDFYTSADDMLAFYTALASEQLVSQRASREMIALLERQTGNDRLPAGVPDGVPVAHKTGELPQVRNDVGIVFAPSGAYVIAVLGNDADDGELVETAIRVSEMTYFYFAQANVWRAMPGLVERKETSVVRQCALNWPTKTAGEEAVRGLP